MSNTNSLISLTIVHKQGDYLALDYIQLIPYMISAIQYMYAELKNSKIV